MKKRWILSVLVILLLIGFSSAEKLNIDIGDTYTPGDKISFKITLYDNNLKPIQGTINYEIQDFLTNIIYQGTTNSNQEIILELPTNTERGYAAIIATYKNIQQKQLFNINELEKAEIQLEEDKLIITNIGNVPYTKSIQISIGNHHETAYIPLEVGQKKEIKLTAPSGEYNIKVSDGTDENTLEFRGISLTGKAVGLEKTTKESFFLQYPLILIFALILGILIIIIFVTKQRER